MLQKERLEITRDGEVKRKSREVEPPKEVADWLERVEKGDIYLAKPVIDDQTGQTLVTSSSANQPKIVLPLTEEEIAWGLKQKVSEAIKWLSEWCLRVVKMNPERINFNN